MTLITQIAQEALSLGYLGLAAQNKINALLQINYDSEDVDALIILQRAIASGRVQQESHRQKYYLPTHHQPNKSSIKLAYQVAAEMAFAAALALTMSNNSQDQASLGT
jgi:hypothetical protein